MKIRKATAKDIPRIQQLYRQLDEHHVCLLPHVFQNVDGNARPDSLIDQWIEEQDADYLLAEKDDIVVGFVNVRKSAYPKHPMFRAREVVLIENAVVDKPYRGKGIGTALFDAAVTWAKNWGVVQIQTNVWNENAGARDFYLAQGFCPTTMNMELNIE